MSKRKLKYYEIKFVRRTPTAWYPTLSDASDLTRYIASTDPRMNNEYWLKWLFESGKFNHKNSFQSCREVSEREIVRRAKRAFLNHLSYLVQM